MKTKPHELSKTIVVNANENSGIWLKLDFDGKNESIIYLTEDALRIIDVYGIETAVPIEVLEESLELLKRKQREGLPALSSQEIFETTVRA